MSTDAPVKLGEPKHCPTCGEEVFGSCRICDEHEPVHAWFELSYSNYLVLPRSVLESMPLEWQRRMVLLLIQLQRKAEEADVTLVSTYWVRAVDEKGRFIREPMPHYRHAPNVFGDSPVDSRVVPTEPDETNGGGHAER